MSPAEAQLSAWERFAAGIASVVGLEPEQVTQSSRIVEDLGFDSLALLELAVLLIDEYGMERLSEQLAERNWENTSAGELFSESQVAARST
jgi:acyl carrier protein